MNWNDSTVLITGGTGSFGHEFTELLLQRHDPQKVIIFSRDELKQHKMRVEGFDHDNLRYFIGDVRDVDRLRRAFEEVDIVVHAAALKRVPACEYNPLEAVMTNIIGAKNVIDASLDRNVSKVIALSTDKAVNPINLYGATKLVAEKLFVQANSYAGKKGTRFSCVRYGNVMGSRGSVIPIFMEQREKGCLTITDPRMTRFWITLEKASEFVMNSAEMMHGGEVFVPKIPSMKIMDLAEAIAPGCDIEYMGIRPGEKIHEVLISKDESRLALELENRYIIQPVHPWWKTENWEEAEPMEEGTEYSSSNNDVWLTKDELKRLLDI